MYIWEVTVLVCWGEFEEQNLRLLMLGYRGGVQTSVGYPWSQ